MPIRHREAFKGAVLAARGIRMPFRHKETELCLISVLVIPSTDWAGNRCVGVSRPWRPDGHVLDAKPNQCPRVKVVGLRRKSVGR